MARDRRESGSASAYLLSDRQYFLSQRYSLTVTSFTKKRDDLVIKCLCIVQRTWLRGCRARHGNDEPKCDDQPKRCKPRQICPHLHAHSPANKDQHIDTPAAARFANVSPRLRYLKLSVGRLAPCCSASASGRNGGPPAPLDDAQEALARKDFGKAVALLQPLAERGDAKAERMLGLLFRDGLGVEKNTQHAFNWINKAANRGDLEAQYALGRIYETGDGVTQDPVQAVAWFLKSAAQGFALAQNSIGLAYEFGRGIPENLNEALTWYRRAASQGHSLSEFNLGRYYYFGIGVPADYGEAKKWLMVAADKGLPAARALLGDFYRMGKGVPVDLAEARNWYLKAAADGHAYAQFELGILYKYGTGVPKDSFESVKWMRLAAQQGHRLAQNELGVAYQTGRGVEQNLSGSACLVPPKCGAGASRCSKQPWSSVLVCDRPIHGVPRSCKVVPQLEPTR